MKSTLLVLLLLPSWLWAAGPDRSAWRDIPSVDFELAPYPEEGSAAYIKDFEELLDLQQTRTRAQCRQGQRQKWPQFSVLFKSEILDVEEFGLVKPFMDQVTSFTERVANYYKDKYDRPRPYNTDARVQPCVEKPTGSKAYPSSHAAIAVADSCVLSEIFPEKEHDLKVYGKELGDLRAIIGVHHPSDVKAGQKLGQEVCDRLMSEPDFAKEVQDLKKSAADRFNNSL